MNEFELVGEERAALGTRATRRLRREGKVPAILYGAEKESIAFVVDANAVKKQLENEAFLSHILDVKIGKQQAQAVLKAIQRDPVSSQVTHMDLQRVSEKKELQIHVPLHFINDDECPGAKAGGIITHLAVELEVKCLPKFLPEYLEVDLATIEIGDTVHMSEIDLPEGVELPALAHGEEYDQALVSVQMPKALEVEEAEEAEEEGEFDEEVAKLVEAGGEAPSEAGGEDESSS